MGEYILMKNNETTVIYNDNEEFLEKNEEEQTENTHSSYNYTNKWDTANDLASEKKEKLTSENIVNLSNNKNLFLFFDSIINGGAHFNDGNFREVKQTLKETVDKYDLSNAEEYAAFGEKFKSSEYFAFAVVLCVFEYVELNDLQFIKSKLLDELPTIINEAGEEVPVHRDPFISTESMLKIINGKMFVSDISENCIGLGESRQMALKNLWQQFPSLRTNIVNWLINLSNNFRYRTRFNVRMIVSAFINIFKIDFNAGVTNFFQKFVSDERKSWLMGCIATELYNDIAFRDLILPHIYRWVDSKVTWLWKPAVYVYSSIKGENNTNFEKKIREFISSYLLKSIKETDVGDIYYLTVRAFWSEGLRDIIASIFNENISKTSNFAKKYLICSLYLEILHCGYLAVTSNRISLPLVICDNKQQLVYILPVIEVALFNYNARCFLFMLLEAYLKEISAYNVPINILNRLKAFFKLIIIKYPKFQDDIMSFLTKCGCYTASIIKQYLDNSNDLGLLGIQ